MVVGRFQSIPDEVHEDVAAKEGFTVVRRCTGGGAMFIEPGNTITYSLYAPRWFAADLDIEESYRLCDMWLIAALRGLGLDVGFSGLNDIASSHGKIGGAAQRRFPPIGSGPGSILHHVTLAYDIDAVKMTRVLNISGEKMSDKAVKSAVKRSGPDAGPDRSEPRRADCASGGLSDATGRSRCKLGYNMTEPTEDRDATGWIPSRGRRCGCGGGWCAVVAISQGLRVEVPACRKRDQEAS